jgi:adenylosuccinate synthase
MPLDIVLGTQWGDEGKGRIADWLAAEADLVARYAGGDNAGHTVCINDQTYKLHLVPSGVLRPNVRCLMGGGMVVNPLRLIEELRELDQRGVDVAPGRILLAETAHLITPAHLALDRARETKRGREAIGTTQRGIGPAYTDKVARTGLRAGEMRDAASFARRVRERITEANQRLALYGVEVVDADQAAVDYGAAAEFLAPYLVDGSRMVHEALQVGQRVLGEGAQGTLLDIDHGHYPFVTSSSPTAGGALTSLGVGPRLVDRVIGVVKAYSTRVGAGPFPTELGDARGDRLRGTGSNPWDEYGTTTGRPRRCGWLDSVVLRYAARINGLTELALTKLDILRGFEQLQIATHYTHQEATLCDLPVDTATYAACEPICEALPGWAEDITSAPTFANLPDAARRYVERIEELVGVPVKLIAVGPARHQTIVR